jgi:hypothetical protein
MRDRPALSSDMMPRDDSNCNSNTYDLNLVISRKRGLETKIDRLTDRQLQSDLDLASK